jgi:hypothetical protein
MKQRLALLEALTSSLEATVRALRVVLDEGGEPTNVVRDEKKSGPRTAFTSADATANLKRLYAVADSAKERARIRAIATKLVDQGLMTKDDAESLGTP